MKNRIYKLFTATALLVATTFVGTSCNEWLDLGPIDYYGSENYWKNEAQVLGYIDGLHKHLRDHTWNHTIIFGEARSGIYVDGVSSDGMTTSYGDIRLQNFDADHTGVSNYANIYGRITNCNLLIARTDEADFLSEGRRNYYQAIAYGLRAFYYFDLFRLYGGVPLRFDVEVIDGVLDPQILYKEQAAPSEVLAQIKSDVNKSIELFGNTTSFDPLGRGNRKSYWSKAASEALAADIYLWSAKVSTGDQKANSADLAIAKRHLQSLVSNYGLSMQTDFSRVFSTDNKGNSEVIFAVRYQEGEATNPNGLYTYSGDTGSTQASGFREDGTPWNDPFGIRNGYTMSMEYVKPMFTQFDKEDSRRDATFMASYRKDEDGELYLNGIHTKKNIGHINASGNRVMDGDYILYRLPWVYLSLAEIANEEGNNSEVERYINLVRERAYGENWSDEYSYKAGNYTQNTLAILKEKDKEFIQEGQRWWDLRRMTLTKGGTHLVFTKEGAVVGDTPLLNEATEAHKVLWPLDKNLLSKEKLLVQTPGYE